MVQELVIRILQANSRKVYTTQTQSLKNSHRLAYVIDHIRTHLHRPITIKELSELACMSESNFYRVFKDELGLSPVAFINQSRIERAIELLKQNDIELKVVFQECGFESRSYFNRVFKRHLSVSPGLYRQRFTRLNGVA
jgi:AraC-like DNA-binding protein